MSHQERVGTSRAWEGEWSQMRTVCAALAVMLLLSVPGCKRGLPEDEQEAQRRIRELEAQLAKAGETEAPRALLTKSETPDLSLDLITVEQLLKKANEAVDAKDAKVATESLDRASECVRAASYSLPRKQMMTRLERSLTLLDRAELSPASRELELARQTDFEANPAALGPDLEEELVAARKKIEQGDPAGARQDILSLLAKLREDEVADLFANAGASIEAAVSALERGGYTAAQGEIAEARKSLSDLEQKLKPSAPAAEKASASVAPTPSAPPAEPDEDAAASEAPETGETEAAPASSEPPGD